MFKKPTKIINQIFTYIGIGFFAILTIATVLLTTRIPDYLQSSLDVHFAPYIIISVAIFAIILGNKFVFPKLGNLNVRKLARIAFIWGFVVSLLWILIADVLPMWDSFDLTTIAHSVSFEPNEFVITYLQRFPFQTPIVMVLFALIKLTGNNYIIAFELLNCLACGLTMYFIVKLTNAIFKQKNTTTISAILVMLFVPLVLYCTFIYGNIISIPFIVAAFYFQKKAIDSSTHFKRNAIISTILMILGVFFKSTFIIAAIAIAIVWIIWGFNRRRWLAVALSVIVIVFAKFSVVPLNLVLEANMKGLDLSHGAPTISWIAMGVGASREYFADQTQDDSQRYEMIRPGYYDSFVWINQDESYSPETNAEISKEYIGRRFEHYQREPVLFFEFFGKKLATEWTEPTFESILASNWCNNTGNEEAYNGYTMCERNYTPIARSVYYGKANAVIIFWLDTLQTILPLGALVALIVYRKKLDISKLATLICVFGFAAIYLVWENKTQYMLPAFLLMIPFASAGWTIILQKISDSRIMKKIHLPSKKQNTKTQKTSKTSK